MLIDIHDSCSFCYHGLAQNSVLINWIFFIAMDGRWPFGDITNNVVSWYFFSVPCFFRKCYYKLSTSWLWWINKWNIDNSFTIADDSTDQRETKGQKAREKYASMLAYKIEVNAKKRESYQYKKAEREATRNNTENLGIIFFITRPISLWIC